MIKREVLRVAIATLVVVALRGMAGQTTVPSAPSAPPYLPQVWDVDWSYLEDRTSRLDATDRLHWIDLGHAGARSLSVSAQVRERGEYEDHPAFGAQPPDNGYLLERLQAGADLRIGPHLRAFLQTESSLVHGRDGGPRPGIDQDTFDFNQEFVDLTPWRRGRDFVTARAGRQLVSLGSTRLVATGVGLNVEQPFDGVRVMVQAGGWSADAIALRPTTTRTGAVDNRPNSTEELWGLTVSHALPGFGVGPRTLHGDVYYLGFDHKQARYSAGVGRELRQTVGGRLWSHTRSWDYDFEYTGQFGSFGARKIRAWATGYHLGYTFERTRFQPHPELDGGYLSGDAGAPNRPLGTFNPLFPNGNYLGEAILLGPSNLILTRPTLKLAITRRLASNTNVEVLWRASTHDGTYNIAGFLIHPVNGSSERSIGAQGQQELLFTFSRHLTGALAFEHFFAGGFLKQSPPGKSVNFISPQLTWNF